MRYLSVIDPGYTPTLGQFMIEANKSQMALNKMDLDEERISRIEFLRKLKDGVQVCFKSYILEYIMYPSRILLPQSKNHNI